MFESIARLVKDPPPEYIFELSEAGLAFARRSAIGDPQQGFVPFPEETLVPSPVEDNIRRPETIHAALVQVAGQAAPSKNLRRAALIVPDYAARVTVLDFDSFPSKAEEQLSLVRFRLKKTLPFDVESALVSYYVQAAKPASGGKMEVVAAAMSLDVIARYEALLRNAGFHPGEVTTSSLAALALHSNSGLSVVAKLAGRVLTAMVIQDDILKLFRCVELEQADEEEVLLVVYPTLAYVEDELGTRVDRLVLCGFHSAALTGVTVPRASLISSGSISGASEAGGWNAGLLGYLESAA